MKKLITIVLVLVLGLTLAACGGSSTEPGSSEEGVYSDEYENSDNVESSSDTNEADETVPFPTLSESLEFAENEFPEYKDSIVYLNNQVNLSKNGIMFRVFYENNKFKDIWSLNSDFSSAFKVLSNYFSTFADIGITEEELENNMKLSTKMPNWKSYKHEDDNFEYTVTVGLDYVQISMTAKTDSLKITTDSIATDSNNKDSELIGGWDYNYAYDINTQNPTTPSIPYVSFYRFNDDGTGRVTINYEEVSGLVETTWEYDYEEDGIYYYAVYLNGDINEKLQVAYVEGVVAMRKDSALMYYKKQT